MKLSKAWTITGCVLLAAFACSSTVAQPPDDMKLCLGELRKAQERLDACNRAITSGRWSGEDLGMLYAFRGNTYAFFKDYDKAIKDYTMQIETDPGSAYGLTSRGAAYTIIGEFDKARRDYNKMLRAENPSIRGGGLAGLAWTEFIAGNFAASVRYVDQYFRSNDEYSEIILLRHISLARMGRKEPREQLKTLALKSMASYEKPPYYEKELTSLFPLATLKLFVGNATDNEYGELLTRVRPDGLLICQWNFYFGEKVLLDGDKEKARQHLQKAADECGGDTRELAAAKAELTRIRW